MSDSEKKRPFEVLNTDDKECPSSKRQRIDVCETTSAEKSYLQPHESKIVENERNSSSDNNELNKTSDDKSDDPGYSKYELQSGKATEVDVKDNLLNFEIKNDDISMERENSNDKEPQTDKNLEYDKTDTKTNTDNELEIKTEVYKNESEDQDDDKSTLKSKGSDKENIDLRNEKSYSANVVMLTDEEENLRIFGNGFPESTTGRSRIFRKIKALQNQLRNEEAVLVLLKKLRQSQIAHPEETIQQTLPSRLVPHQQQISQLHMKPHRGPPPLVRDNQLSSKTFHHFSQNAHVRAQQMNNQPLRSQQGPPPLVMVPRTANGHEGLPQLSKGFHGNVPQNMTRGNEENCSQQLQATPRQAVIPPAPLQVQDVQTAAQRQATAKQALRKQLEKTLLQIPPPKPPPPEMNFIPSLACPDFVLLLGLEEIVNHMIDYQLISSGQKNPDERFVCTPFTCVQCASDFTPVWKREKPGSKNVICEYCVTTNQKKALKQEHTNRLKSAFVKALQQEQEIEHMQSTPTPTPQPISSTTPQPHHPSVPMISATSAATAAVNAAAAATAAVNAAAAVASLRPNSELLRQQHSFFQQAQPRAGQPLGLQAFSHTPYSYTIPFTSQQDLQRQYLLDMIPRGSMPWKQ